LPARLEVVGWLLLGDGPPDTIEAVATGGEKRTAARVDRPDVAEVFPAIPDAAGSGFRVTLPATIFAPQGDYDFTLQARRPGPPALRRPVVGRRTRATS